MPEIHRLGFLPIASVLMLASACATPPPPPTTAVAPPASPPVAPPASTAVPPSAPSGRTVYLNGPEAVENLKAEDPAHYAQVKSLLAAANVVCAPGPGALQQARHDAGCEALFVKTSFPPKRQIRFTLDGTQYIALVVLTKVQPTLVPAEQTKAR